MLGCLWGCFGCLWSFWVCVCWVFMGFLGMCVLGVFGESVWWQSLGCLCDGKRWFVVVYEVEEE